MKLADKKIFFLLSLLVIGLLVSLGVNSYLLSEIGDIREILDAQFEVIRRLMEMQGFRFEDSA